MTEAVLRFVERLDGAVGHAVGSRLVGTYLHGSAALGGFIAGRSDVDVLLIVSDATLPITAGKLATVTCSVGTDCPGRGLELSVVTAVAARDPAAPWPFIVHVATEGDRPPKDCRRPRSRRSRSVHALRRRARRTTPNLPAGSRRHRGDR